MELAEAVAIRRASGCDAPADRDRERAKEQGGGDRGPHGRRGGQEEYRDRELDQRECGPDRRRQSARNPEGGDGPP
jgi:hypothetical protein